MSEDQLIPLEISSLRLDPENPRLPEESLGSNQAELAKFIAQAYDSLSVALSIAEHGFFQSEPLIAIHEGDYYVVVEGNRRLTALLGLVDEGIRATFDDAAEWNRAAEVAVHQGNLPTTVPVLVVSDRKSVAPIIGYRHISGILPWEPFAKARFIAGLVEGEDLSFAEVADIVGEKKGDVQATYRNFQILRQAKDKHHIDTSRVEASFGVFTAAMNQVKIREFVGAPAPGQVSVSTDPIPEERSENLGKLIVWLAGDSAEEGRIITDSRDLRFLGEALVSPAGVLALESGVDVRDAAEAASESEVDPRRQIQNRLVAARSSIRFALAQVSDVERDEGIVDLVNECIRDLEELRTILAR